MLKKIFSTLMFLFALQLFFTNDFYAQTTPDFLWAASAGGFGLDGGTDVVTDNQGNIFVTGYFETTAIFGDTSLITETANTFIAKLDSQGRFLWAKSVFNFGSTEVVAITLDNSGNIIITGNFTGRFQVETGEELNSFGGNDVFIIKYSPDGDLIWLTQYGDVSDNYVNDISSHGLNNIYFTGYNRFTGSFENQIFIAAFNTSGNLQWQRSMTGRSFYDQGTGIVVNNLDNLFVTGAFGDTVTFAGTNAFTSDSTVISNGASDMFLAKYNLAGNLIWVKNVNQPLYDEGGKISTDINANVIFTGLTSIGNGSDVYLAKYTDDGNQVWEAFERFEPYNDNVKSDIDDAGNVSLIYRSSLGEQPQQGGNSIFFSRFDNLGNKLWNTSFGSSNFNTQGDIYVDNNGDIILTGSFGDNGVFGDTILISQQGTNDVFVTKVSSPKINFDPDFLDFGNVLVGENIQDQVIIENTTGSVLYISDVYITEVNQEFNYSFLTSFPNSIPPFQSLTVDIVFAPLNAGLKEAYLILESDAPTTPDTVFLTGMGTLPALTFSADSLNFGNVEISDSSELILTVSNLSSAELTIDNLLMTNNEYEIIDPVIPDTILPDENRILQLRFIPSNQGLRQGSLIITSNSGSNIDTIFLYGTGQFPSLTFSPDTLNFGTVDVNNSSDITLTISNEHTFERIVNRATISGINQSDFELINPPQFPFTIPAGGFLNLNVRFLPLTSGLKSGILEVVSDSSDMVGLSINRDTIILSGDAIESIIVNLPDSTIIGQSTTVNANSPGPSFTTNQFFYRRTGESVYQQAQLELLGNNYSGDIPPEFSTMRGIQFYIVFTDTVEGGTITYPSIDPVNNPASIQVRIPSLDFPIPLAANKYQMISIPLAISDPELSSVLEDDFGLYDNKLWRLFRWDPSANSYSEFENINDNFQPGNSFWLINRGVQTFDIDNTLSVPSNNSYTITLLPGWNQIANPFAFPVDWSIVGNSGLLTQAPASWNPDTEEYEYDQLVLNPWEGYWVYDSLQQVINLSVPPVESIGGLEKNIYKKFSSNSFVVQIKSKVELTDNKDDQNYVGMDINAFNSYDKFDIIEAPPISDNLRLSIISEGRKYARNIVPLSPEGSYWDLKITSGYLNKNINLQFEEKIALPEEFKIWLLDIEEKHSLPVINSSLTINMGSREERNLRLIIGSEDYANKVSGNISLVPDEYKLFQNFPNPFNPATNIYFTLKQNSNVTLEIFDILGRRIKSLIENKELNAGLQHLVWDGSDLSGKKVSSGIYIYRIKANDFTDSKKMMLLK